ncbi:MAG: hypothetical protein KIT83_02225 [Bryobacterales bacterium]|nr:hypothetical protein [Bryobacterales bacterium]
MRTQLILIAAIAAFTTVAAAQTIRVGVFDSKAAVIGFYRSPKWAATIKAKHAEMDAAKKANDTARIQALEAWGSGKQDMAHRQLAGEAPIANILEALAAGLPEIAQGAGVVLIVPDLPYADKSVQTVDVTERVLDFFEADLRTRALVKEMTKHVH